ncbi:MAG: winged helix-turn-helix transcriptional regulator [Jatrophihabitans sp.]
MADVDHQDGLPPAVAEELRVDEGPPVTVDYRLTASGEALLPALEELTSWAASNLPE